MSEAAADVCVAVPEKEESQEVIVEKEENKSESSEGSVADASDVSGKERSEKQDIPVIAKEEEEEEESNEVVESCDEEKESKEAVKPCEEEINTKEASSDIEKKDEQCEPSSSSVESETKLPNEETSAKKKIEEKSEEEAPEKSAPKEIVMKEEEEEEEEIIALPSDSKSSNKPKPSETLPNQDTEVKDVKKKEEKSEERNENLSKESGVENKELEKKIQELTLQATAASEREQKYEIEITKLRNEYSESVQDLKKSLEESKEEILHLTKKLRETTDDYEIMRDERKEFKHALKETLAVKKELVSQFRELATESIEKWTEAMESLEEDSSDEESDSDYLSDEESKPKKKKAPAPPPPARSSTPVKVQPPPPSGKPKGKPAPPPGRPAPPPGQPKPPPPATGLAAPLTKPLPPSFSVGKARAPPPGTRGSSSPFVRPKIVNPIMTIKEKGMKQLEMNWDENNHVTQLLLPNNLLTSLPEELASLSNLTVLDVSHNRFESIPPCLFTLHDVKEGREGAKGFKKLNFAGNRISSFDGDWSAFTCLEECNLENNKLRTLPCEVLEGVKSSLQVLHLTRNELEALPEGIVDVVSLSSLYASHNQIVSIPEGLGKLEYLGELFLSHNKLQSLPDVFHNAPYLSIIDISFNELTKLPSSLGKLASLISLHANNNRISSLQPELFLDENFGISELHMQHNALSSLPIELWEIDTISLLNFSANHISMLPSELGHLTGLQRLIMADNELECVPDELGSLEYLEELNLSFNRLTTLPLSIGKLYSLEKFYVAYNDLESIPELDECLRLQEFFVSGNRRLHCLPTSLFTKNTSISHIYASQLNMKGSFPCVGNLEDLEVLDISFNSISDLPPTLGNVPLLRRVNATHNHLSGNIPSFSSSYDVVNLDFSFNDFASVPEEFTSLLERNVELLFDGNPVSGAAHPDVIHIHRSDRFTIGMADMIGRRPTMEDAMAICGSFGSATKDFFGLYDGHAGREAAAWCGKRIHSKMKALYEENDEKDLLECLAESYPAVNKDFRSFMKSDLWDGHSKHCGTTAVSVFMDDDKLFVVNVGDSRAVMCRDGNALRLSFDHKPYAQEEEDRIRELGGCVSGSTGRVNGLLAIPRALGDYYMHPFVTDEPFKAQYTRTEKDSFMVVGCDGVWDEVSDDKAISLVLAEPHPFKASCVLRDYAYLLGSDDNISVIVVQFKN